jgi:Flp pilus assembly protein TadD
MTLTSKRYDTAAPPGQRLRSIAAGILIGGALFGCAATGEQKQSSWHTGRAAMMRALPLAVTGTPAAADYYALGRHEYYSGRFAMAEAAYRRALQLDPDAAEAFNGLAVLHDRLGRYDLSAVEYRAALSRAPAAPHILANLGYSLLLQGRAEEALPLLRRAAALAPDNDVTRANLARAETVAAAAAAVAFATDEPAATVSPAEAAADAASEPLTATTEPGAEPLRHGIVVGVVGAASLAPPAVAQVPSKPAPSLIASVQGAELRTAPALGELFAGMRVEVANGNGVTGMARAMRTRLHADGLRVTRVTNARPFNKRRTVIICAAAQRPQAIALAKKLSISPRFIIASTQHRNVDLRLILGADLVRQAALPTAGRQLAMLP